MCSSDLAKQGRQQLEELFAQEREQARAEQRRRHDWNGEDAPPSLPKAD